MIIDLSLCELSPQARNFLVISSKKRIFLERILKIQEKVSGNKFGTEGYMSPETILCENEQKMAVDIWAFGIICLQIFSKKMFVFCPLNMMVFDKSSRKLRKKENYIANFLLQCSVLLGPNEVKGYCSKKGYFVSFPTKLLGNIESLKTFVKITDFQEWGWNLVEKCLIFDPTHRISSKTLLKLIEEKLFIK